MSSIFYMIIITKREFEEAYLNFFRENDVHMVLSDLCRGTAQKKTLDYLGIEKTEKITFHNIEIEKEEGKAKKSCKPDGN